MPPAIYDMTTITSALMLKYLDLSNRACSLSAFKMATINRETSNFRLFIFLINSYFDQKCVTQTDQLFWINLKQ